MKYVIGSKVSKQIDLAKEVGVENIQKWIVFLDKVKKTGLTNMYDLKTIIYIANILQENEFVEYFEKNKKKVYCYVGNYGG